VDVPGAGASFNQEMIDLAKDPARIIGQYDPSWRLVAGLDLAGGTKDSGFTAGVLMGVDLRSGDRYVVDIFNVKSMRAPALKDQILEWSARYPIYEWRVENNGLQAQIVQYNEEIVRELAKKGIRIQPHNTNNNKWDDEFGVDSMAPGYSSGQIHLPWGGAQTQRVIQPLIEQLIRFPMGATDMVMAHWFADLGCRTLMTRAHLPMFSDRMKVPERIRRRRVVVDFSSQRVTKVPPHEQQARMPQTAALRGYRRHVVGHPGDGTVEEAAEVAAETVGKPYANVAGNVPAA
jgi:phage terminase large subunit-like protein